MQISFIEDARIARAPRHGTRRAWGGSPAQRSRGEIPLSITWEVFWAETRGISGAAHGDSTIPWGHPKIFATFLFRHTRTLLILGSNTSRRPSPMKFNASTVMTMAIPGKNAYHHD